MKHISIHRIALQNGNDERMLEAAQTLFAARRALLGDGLVSMQLVRSADSSEYALISVWASAEADAVHENDAAERDAATRIGPVVASAPSEFKGSVVAELQP